MSLEIACNICEAEINEPGALIFGAVGVNGRRPKKHICLACWPKLEPMCAPVRFHTLSAGSIVVGPPDQQGDVQEYRLQVDGPLIRT